MIYFGKTDIGKRRMANQDSFGIYKIAENSMLFVVCDGMGGANGGEEASKLALDAFHGEIKSSCASFINEEVLDICRVDMDILLKNALSEANNAVYRAAIDNPALSGMGTTLVALFVIDGKAVSLNVGDSRMYKINSEGIKQITHDHSYVQYLIDIGQITPEEAKKNSKRNIITRAVGTSDELEGDIEDVELGEGSYFLLCSDGLTGMVGDTEISETVLSEGSIEDKVNTLIEKANENGGIDNITAILLSLL